MNNDNSNVFDNIVSINKNYVIIKAKNMSIEHNSDTFIMYCVELTKNVIKIYSKIYVIIDLYELNMKNIKINFIIKFIKTFKKTYPDKLNKCIIINVTKSFNKIFKMLKIFLDKDTIDKIDIREIKDDKNEYDNNYMKL